TYAALADPAFLALPDTRSLDRAADRGIEVLAGSGSRRMLDAPHMANARRFTTADVLAAEEVVLRAGAERARGAACVRIDTAAMAINTVEVGSGHRLSDEQTAAVLRLLTSDRALDAVLGAPGTGKTTM